MTRRRAIALTFVTALVVASLPAIAMASSFQVYVGYSDSLRPSGFFPNPWCGSAGVTSCQVQGGGAQLDAGAVRILNTGATPLTISDMAVSLNAGADTFQLWSAATIGTGENAIFGQTSQFNFDTSDYGFLPNGIGIDGTHPLGGCTNLGALSAAQAADCSSLAPVVSFQANGTPFSFKDTGNILNTFGYDFVCCSSDGNESINWNLIGSAASRGGTVPEPGTAWLFLTGGGLAFGALRRRFLSA